MQKPILVTGPHRSGSTWVGRMLALAPDVGYIHEPFNPSCRPGICAAQTNRYFLHVYDDDPDRWRRALADTLSFQYNIAAEWEAIQSPKDIARLARDVSRFEWHRWRGHRALMKDPIALFSAEWIADTFDADVVLLMRHPAAFVSSLKRLDWTFPFHHLLQQPELVRSHLAPFEEEIREFENEKRDIVAQGTLLWRIFAHYISQLHERREDWIIARHEDLSRQPVEQFQRIYRELGLSFNERVEQIIRKHSNASNSAEVQTDTVHQLHRDSRQNVYRWKERLTAGEIKYICGKVEEEQDGFYSDEDWMVKPAPEEA